MSTKQHVVITGTGRSGTTFLVELLTYLGLDTGFTPENLDSRRYELARAGLEYDLTMEECPYIVKKIRFCEHARQILSQNDIRIDHVFIPMRDLYSAAESRRFVQKSTLSEMSPIDRWALSEIKKELPGGLWHTTSSEAGEQERILLEQLYELLLALSDTMVPVTVMRYPRIVNDAAYLFHKLEPVLQGIPFERFDAAFAKTVRPDLVHSFSENDR